MSFLEKHTSDIKPLLATIGELSDFKFTALPRKLAKKNWNIELHKTDEKTSHWIVKMVYQDFEPEYIQAYKMFEKGNSLMYYNIKSVDDALNSITINSITEEVVLSL